MPDERRDTNLELKTLGEIVHELMKRLDIVLPIVHRIQRYRPVRESDLSTDDGVYLLRWLRDGLDLSPFGVSSFCEGIDKEVEVALKGAKGNQRIKTVLHSLAGIHMLYHNNGMRDYTNIHYKIVSYAASFDDVIKVYSLKERKYKNRWNDLNAILRKRKGNTAFKRERRNPLTMFDAPEIDKLGLIGRDRHVIYSRINKYRHYKVIDELMPAVSQLGILDPNRLIDYPSYISVLVKDEPEKYPPSDV